ncbi:zinc ribbon domain-containing protein [Microlunatus sagamiharensis]|uniref:zinc ribbon domain-containing protein n=1 Tax=Microlunatus sagamiharensis TaxID=546874 RepID=UPI001E5B1B62|nr:zinc ribbon domain-containing protein [Microlunatus sagamiharensis]
MQAVLSARAPSWPGASRQLLSGVARCGACDAPIHSGGARNGRRRYRCSQKGGHAYREAEPVDNYVGEVVIARLNRPDAIELISSADANDVSEVQRDIRALNVRRDAIAEGFADGSVSLSQFKAANARLSARMQELEAKVPTPGLPALAHLATARDPREVWGSLDIDVRRQVIDVLMVVRLVPVGTKERAYLDVEARIVNPETVQIAWRV